jgi:hypothetical protein
MKTMMWSFTTGTDSGPIRTSIHTTAREAYAAFLIAWQGDGNPDPVADDLLAAAVDSGRYFTLDKYLQENDRAALTGEFHVECHEVEIELPPVIQGKRIPGRTDGAIAAVVINAADICGVVMSRGPANCKTRAYGLTMERAAQYLAEHGEDVTDALLLDWPHVVGPVESLETFVATHAKPLEMY